LGSPERAGYLSPGWSAGGSAKARSPGFRIEQIQSPERATYSQANLRTAKSMPQSLSRILVHLVFSTKDRAPLLRQPLRDELFVYLGGVLREHGCQPIKIGGVEDHVHVFFGLSRTMSLSEAVGLVKTSSSRWVKSKGAAYSDFAWQAGYGAFSVSQSSADAVASYVAAQEEHHRARDFRDEFRGLLVRHNVEFDERYLWE